MKAPALVFIFFLSSVAHARPVHTIRPPTPAAEQPAPNEQLPSAMEWEPPKKPFGAEIASTARKLLGWPYGTTADHVDCSGLVRKVFGEHHWVLPRSAQEQARYGVPVEWKDIRAGDLLFFARIPHGRVINHVGIAAGGGQMIHASLKRQRVVIDPLTITYYKTRRVMARRLVE